MNELISKFDNVISLGYNCYTKLYLNKIGMEQETHFFDYIGTSTWSIIDMFKNNFEGVFDPNEYKITQVMFKGPDKYLVVNQKYFIRCKHEFPKSLENENELRINKLELKDFLEKLERRKERFLNMLRNDKSLLFIRYEEDPYGRIPFHNYDEKYKVPIVENLKQIINIFQSFNSKKKIYIMDLSYKHHKSEFLKDSNIIKIKMDERIPRWEYAHNYIIDALKKEEELLSKINI